MYLDQLQHDLVRIFQPVDGTDRNVDRFTLVNRLDEIIDRDPCSIAHNNPVLRAIKILLSGCNPAPDTWQEVDLTQFQVAPSAIEADLAGQLIITPGTVAGTPLLGIKFRAAGTTTSPEFQGYTIAQSGPTTLGMNGQLNAGFVGARIPFSARVPIANGKLEYSWSYKTTSATVTTEAYMVDLALVGWCD